MHRSWRASRRSFDKLRSNWESRKKLIYREVKLMERICEADSGRLNAHVIAFHEYIDTGAHLYVVMDEVGGGNLRQELNRRPTRRFSEGTAKEHFWQICDGVKYLHNNLVVHRDLKLENLLLMRNREVLTGSYDGVTPSANDDTAIRLDSLGRGRVCCLRSAAS